MSTLLLKTSARSRAHHGTLRLTTSVSARAHRAPALLASTVRPIAHHVLREATAQARVVLGGDR
ncbi:hypothetical protein JY651_48330 [Pyxidicoccus parkwayensis]|uniref:Uncharacterized protein n=1 Tax=Pyxidicoccus parkwayensis TaxID=2813578 RepID=A0ABX7P1Y0_9BACT|nr:hypothetical protein [Pyxidicoccus parkwaysis]QSQ22823.1 hypothetical protein JY651_48330 [Pyxidicoccus parkwaysis]